MTEPAREPAALSCGCRCLPRRRCDLCPAAASAFLACGTACLQRHLARAHPGAPDSHARARAFQAEVNRLGIGAGETYRAHRARLTGLLGAVQRGQGLCVLGAGNAHDLDLPALLGLFGQVHLVDLDGEALARAVAGLSPSARERVTLHPGLDLSGCLDHLDTWGDGLPDGPALIALADAGARTLSARVGGGFDVVLSACVLSQLCHPLQNTLALTAPDWRRLFAAVTRLHLATVALLTRPGGTGVIACDVLCHASAAIDELRARTGPEGLGDPLLRAVECGAIAPEPDPRTLASLLQTAPLAALVERVHVTTPWLWDLGPTAQVVYGVLFRRT